MATFAEAKHSDAQSRAIRGIRAERGENSAERAESRPSFQIFGKRAQPSAPTARSAASRTKISAQTSPRQQKVTAKIQVNTGQKRKGLFARLKQASVSSTAGQSQKRAPRTSPLRGIQPTLDVRTTAYTHSESDHLAYGRKTAVGSTLRSSTGYTSAAADWSRFPLGTTFEIVGEPTTYVIDDYGSALVGTNTIDIYRPSRASMNRWGVRHVKIKILKVGCFDSSRNHLAKATDYWHCRAMYVALS